MKMTRVIKIQLLLLFSLFGTLLFKIHNSFDSLPSARAFVSDWLKHDWYLSQFVPYRFLFNIPAGLVYDFTSFWGCFFIMKTILFLAFAKVISRIYEKLDLSLLAILVSFLYFLTNQSLIAMEWIVGDSDAKPVAYVLFFFALKDFLDNKLNWKTFFLLGLSASFHVLVGGYLSILFFMSLLLFRVRPMLSWILSYLAGASVAIFAVIYELTQASGGQADQIYVFTRLSHHLVPDWDMNRWLWKYLLFNGFLVWGYFKKNDVWKKFISITLFSNIFWVTGLVVYHLGLHSLLKYYFFRVPDSLIPFTSYIVITSLILEKLPARFKEHRVILPLVLAIFSARTGFEWVNFQKSHHKRVESLSWIENLVDEKAVVLADPNLSSFYAYTNRSLYVSYKHLPQIKAYILEYPQRLQFALGRSVGNTPLERKEITESFDENLARLTSQDLQSQGITHVLSPVELGFELVGKSSDWYLYRVGE